MDKTTASPQPDIKLAYRNFSDRLLELWAPRGMRNRLVLSPSGVAEIEIQDRFSEQILDLHWQTVATYLTTGDPEQLAEFEGLELGGHRLACTLEGVAACFRSVEE